MIDFCGVLCNWEAFGAQIRLVKCVVMLILGFWHLRFLESVIFLH